MEYVIVIRTKTNQGLFSNGSTTGPVASTIEVYDRKFTIVDYASVWSVTYNHNL